jgi:hypothetical protein
VNVKSDDPSSDNRQRVHVVVIEVWLNVYYLRLHVQVQQLLSAKDIAVLYLTL